MSFTPTVLVGPSGVGKGTVLSFLCARYPKVWLSVSVTTRQPRPGEVHGQHYYFISESEFDQLIDSDGLLEWARYESSRYGTPRVEVEEKIHAGCAVIMEVDTQGAFQIKTRLDPVRTVFLAPPSWEELEARLRGRATETEQVIKRRLKEAKREMKLMDEFDHVIVNREVAVAVEELVNLIGLNTGEQLDLAEKEIHS